jgi:hypothetical protein
MGKAKKYSPEQIVNLPRPVRMLTEVCPLLLRATETGSSLFAFDRTADMQSTVLLNSTNC